MKNCKRCNSSMTLRSYEASGQYEIHTHHICTKDSAHPYYCVQERRWVG